MQERRSASKDAQTQEKMLAFDDCLPTVIMEEDNETELEIVQPILNDIVNEVFNQNSLKNLQNIMDLTMEQVAVETHENFFKSILETCINKAVETSEKSKEGQFESNP